MRDSLELFDGPAEGLTARSVSDRSVESCLRHPDDGGADAAAEQVEGPHSELEAAVDLAQELLFRHENAIQLQPADGVR